MLADCNEWKNFSCVVGSYAKSEHETCSVKEY